MYGMTWALNGRNVVPGDRVVHVGGDLAALGIVCMVLGFILWAVIVTTLVLVIIDLIRRQKRPLPGPAGAGFKAAPALPAAAPGGPAGAPAGPDAATAGPDALTILEERYARGELDHKEYLQRKANLTGPQSSSS